MVLLKTVEEDHDLEISWKTGAAAQISQIFYLFIFTLCFLWTLYKANKIQEMLFLEYQVKKQCHSVSLV